jgi:tetratricopeptide (TPR) repeat protein
VVEAAGLMGAGDEVDVDQVFAKFKEGVRAQVAESDSQTHYDLGVAYKEMGLLPDAIHEFELAAREPARECPCYAMIGMICLEQGELDKASEAYKRALLAPQKIVEQEMALYYDLGNVYEMKGVPGDALYYFQKIRAPRSRLPRRERSHRRPAARTGTETRAAISRRQRRRRIRPGLRRPVQHEVRNAQSSATYGSSGSSCRAATSARDSGCPERKRMRNARSRACCDAAGTPIRRRPTL